MSEKLSIRPAAIIIKDNKLLMVKTRKHGEEYYLLLGGGIEYGETIEEALKREVLEETGFIVKILKPVYINEYIHRDNKSKRVVNIFFITKILGIDKTRKINDDDIVEVMLIDIDKLDKIELYPKKLREYIKEDLKKDFNEFRYWVDIV